MKQNSTYGRVLKLTWYTDSDYDDVILHIIQPVFLLTLASLLADAGRSAVARTAAGLQLKNYLSSKNPDTKRQQILTWLQIDAAIREQVKTLALGALGTESSTTSSAAQVCINIIETVCSNCSVLVCSISCSSRVT